MSDTVSVALITGGTTGLVGLAALAFNFWNSSRERQQRLVERRDDYREWYRRTLFEDRLRAVREGYAWLMRLNRALSRPNGDSSDSEDNQRLDQMFLDCREWWDNNAVFLYDDLPRASEFIGFINDPRGSGSFMRAEAEIRNRLRQILATERNDRSGGGHDH
jgi:hypothetical protein